ncbi:MAG TPA: type II toxin-antitoxin system RelE/ParE family toxin [Burkholderiales bacterium]
MKPVTFLGDSLEAVRAFPVTARREAGFQLDRVQRGLLPENWKPLKTVGPGVNEIRARDEAGAFRVIYVASFPEALYVLHAFQKKTQKTAKGDLDLARARFKLLRKER